MIQTVEFDCSRPHFQKQAKYCRKKFRSFDGDFQKLKQNLKATALSSGFNTILQQALFGNRIPRLGEAFVFKKRWPCSETGGAQGGYRFVFLLNESLDTPSLEIVFVDVFHKSFQSDINWKSLKDV